MGSKASALPTWDGQGQSLPSKRWDSTINPTMESMPCHWPAYMHTFCQRSHFQRSDGNGGPLPHARRAHLPTQNRYTVTRTGLNHSQLHKQRMSTGQGKDNHTDSHRHRDDSINERRLKATVSISSLSEKIKSLHPPRTLGDGHAACLIAGGVGELISVTGWNLLTGIGCDSWLTCQETFILLYRPIILWAKRVNCADQYVWDELAGPTK